MELVGTVLECREGADGLQIVFRCTNKETFLLKVPPIIKWIPHGVLLRVWTHRPEDEAGMPSKENVLNHWEQL